MTWRVALHMAKATTNVPRSIEYDFVSKMKAYRRVNAA